MSFVTAPKVRLTTAARIRLQKEYKMLQKDPPPGIRVSLDKTNEDDGSSNDNNNNDNNNGTNDIPSQPQPPQPPLTPFWTATLQGPPESPFEGISFTVKLQFPLRYPLEPPHCQFVLPHIPFHPNIDDQGRICLDTLKRPPGGSWSPAVSVRTLLLSLQILLGHPNASDGLEPKATQLYQRDPQAWFQQAKTRIRQQEQSAVQNEQQAGNSKKQPPETKRRPRDNDHNNQEEEEKRRKKAKPSRHTAS